MSYDFDSFIDAADSEAWPNESESEMETLESLDAESRRRRPPPPVRGASGAPTFRPRAGGTAGAGGSVTQAQLEAALARVRQQITANATAIKTIDGRVRTVISDQQKLQAATRKEVDKLRSSLKTTQMLSAFIPLFATQGSGLENVAPLLHLVGAEGFGGGQAGSGGTGGGLLGGNTNNLITIGALLYASGVLEK